MSLVNGLLRPVVDVLLAPLRGLPPLVGVTLVSLLFAIVILLAFKRLSNQTALDEVKRKIHASLFEIRLFNDDFRAIMRAQFDILRTNLSYMRLSMVPMLWTLPPLFLLVAQLQFHYGYHGLEPGEEVLLKVELADGAYAAGEKPEIDIDIPDGLRLRTPAVWIPTLGEMAWRLTAETPGDYELVIRNGSETITKTVRVTDRVVRLSPFKIRGFLNQLLYPAEPALPRDGGIDAVTVTYRDATIDVFGIELHWLIVFFVLSIVFALMLRGPMGVTV